MLTVTSMYLNSCADSCRKMDCGIGSCYDGTCVCEKWYSGSNCDLSYNRNYEGIYYGTALDIERSLSKSLEIVADENEPNRMNIKGGVFYEFFNDSILTIPLQILLVEDDSTISVAGQGSYGDSLLSFEYETQQMVNRAWIPTGEKCSFYGSKK